MRNEIRVKQSDVNELQTDQVPENNEDEHFFRNLVNFEGGLNVELFPKDPQKESPLEDPHYPDFVPDQSDLERLAHSYLEESVSLFRYSFITGWNEEKIASLLLEKFERVAVHLGNESRQKIIDVLDSQRKRTDGDEWEVFKYANQRFWSTPADFDAVLRVAESVLAAMPPPDEDQQYGLKFLDTLKAARKCANKNHRTD